MVQYVIWPTRGRAAYAVCLYTVQKKDQQHFVHNFGTFKCIVVIFGIERRENNSKLSIKPLFASPNQCCYFILQNEMLDISLLHANVSGVAKGGSRGNCPP